ncbi:MAG: MarR family winged helix-turn-helix transcriptional regulator [Actinomycetota bacterium]|nr:MarR family winged helix-turn-helix transcriptional regulator [Actinomycetota bacterium]
MIGRRLEARDYHRLLTFRDGLRRFQHWSEAQAAAVGLTPSQHQLLLAIRGHDGDGLAGHTPPAVGDVAAHLMLRHHSAVELINRAVGAGLVVRHADPADHRVVRLDLTPEGARRLEALTALHLDELSRLAPGLAPLWEGLEG